MDPPHDGNQVCPLCQRAFMTQTALQEHIDIEHPGDDPVYTCEEVNCKQKYNPRSVKGFVRHMATHVNKRKKCDACKKWLKINPNRPDNLPTHLNTCSGRRAPPNTTTWPNTNIKAIYDARCRAPKGRRKIPPKQMIVGTSKGPATPRRNKPPKRPHAEYTQGPEEASSSRTPYDGFALDPIATARDVNQISPDELSRLIQRAGRPVPQPDSDNPTAPVQGAPDMTEQDSYMTSVIPSLHISSVGDIPHAYSNEIAGPSDGMVVDQNYLSQQYGSEPFPPFHNEMANTMPHGDTITFLPDTQQAMLAMAPTLAYFDTAAWRPIYAPTYNQYTEGQLSGTNTNSTLNTGGSWRSFRDREFGDVDQAHQVPFSGWEERPPPWDPSGPQDDMDMAPDDPFPPE